MTIYQPYIDWLDGQQEAMTSLLETWSDLNSGTFHLAGLRNQARLLHAEFAEIADELHFETAGSFETIDVHGHSQIRPLGDHLVVSRRAKAPRRVLLAIHMDTVYGEESPFQKCVRVDPQTLRGPGVADAKGGLVILLYALRTLEEFVRKTGQRDLGWDVVINSDEEIGSPGSLAIFKWAAGRVQAGLLFEPSLPGGDLVSSRKGSGNFSVAARGRAAHSGRDFAHGRNAVVAAAEAAAKLHQLTGRWPEMTLNVARIDGGGPSNMVPAVAVLRFNVRYLQRENELEILQAIKKILAEVEARLDVRLELQGHFNSPPKACGLGTQLMLEQIRECGKDIGLDVGWAPSGGACDGNRLAAMGLPNVDTLGVRGGKIHSEEEFVLLESLPERAKLTALYLMQLAEGAISPPPREDV